MWNNEARAHIIHYSVNLRIQTYTVPVPLNMENSSQNICGYTDIFTVWVRLYVVPYASGCFIARSCDFFPRELFDY